MTQSDISGNEQVPPGPFGWTARIVLTESGKVQLDHGQGVVMELERDGTSVIIRTTQRVELGNDGAAWLGEWLGRA